MHSAGPPDDPDETFIASTRAGPHPALPSQPPPARGSFPKAAMVTAIIPPSSPTPQRRIAVAELLAGAQEVILVHGAQEYRLRLTRAGKLILTK